MPYASATLTRNAVLGLLLLAMFVASSAGQVITITVNASRSTGTFEPVWAYVGHDEPNYTYSGEGRDLLTKLSQLSPYPIHDRTHNLLTSGDGTPSLKWGSTHVFTRDAAGKPVYDWSILDRILDTYKNTGVIPLVEIGFMPEALSTHPEPYQHHWPKTFATGWSYPPTDYREWSDLVYQWVRHTVDRYGATEVAKWDWEVWNEPDIFYWHGTADEYFKLYDYTVAAVRKALPNAHVGGPASTGPNGQKGADFLRSFLEHCAGGQNYATGAKGVPLDFISFHAKGKATYANGHSELNVGANLRDIAQGFAIIEKFPTLRHLPVLLTESDPESCAACDATSHPENSYRLTSQYATYQAELLNGTMSLAQQHHINLKGSTSWAFTFPGQPIFAGLRAFTTHNIDLPSLNALRMFGQMKGERLDAKSSGELALADVVQSSVREKPDVNVIATRDSHHIEVLIWNYHDSADSSPVEIHLKLTSLPAGVSQVVLRHWRIDHDHSNAYTVWQDLGSPQNPTPEQYAKLKAAGQLQLLDSPQWEASKQGTVALEFALPRQAVSLVELTW